MTIRHDWMETAGDKAKAAIREGRTEDSLGGVDEIWYEGRPAHDLYGDMAAAFLDFIDGRIGGKRLSKSRGAMWARNFGLSRVGKDWSFGPKDALYYCAHTKPWFDALTRECGDGFI